MAKRRKPAETKPNTYPDAMPLTLEQIVEETGTWSDDQLVVLVNRLTQRLQEIDPQIEEALAKGDTPAH